MRVQSDLRAALNGVDALVLAVPHESYLELAPDDVLDMGGRHPGGVDCFGMLDDNQIRRYFELGCEVKGLGHGHIQRLKKEVRNDS